MPSLIIQLKNAPTQRPAQKNAIPLICRQTIPTTVKRNAHHRLMGNAFLTNSIARDDEKEYKIFRFA